MTPAVAIALALATFAAVLAVLTWVRVSLHLDAETARRPAPPSLLLHTHSSERS